MADKTINWAEANRILEEGWPDCHNRFMQPCVTDEQTWYRIETHSGETYIAHEANSFREDDDGNILNDQDLFFEGGLAKAGEYTVEKFLGYGAQMEAPGYLDQTDWIVCDTPQEAAQELAEYHSDNDCDCKPESEDTLEDGVTPEDYRRDQAADGLINEEGYDAHGNPLKDS